MTTESRTRKHELEAGSVPVVKRLILPSTMFLTFWTLAIVFWQISGFIFFLFNFGYIGTSLGVGMGMYSLLPRKKKPQGRKLAQFLVGGYMLGLLGFVASENMQIEGFFFFLFTGIFSGPVIHYTIAKIIGPMIFNRAWCSWACWTAMILDVLPYNRSTGWVRGRLPLIRYAFFAACLGLVLIFWFGFSFRMDTVQQSMLWLIAGNALYYAVAIWMAYHYKDNRAFCKYLCPITVFMKATSRFALLKIRGDANTCTDCGACTKTCPMDIDIPAYVLEDRRVLSTECVLCQTCVTVCPRNSLRVSFGLDLGGREQLVVRDGAVRGRRISPSQARPVPASDNRASCPAAAGALARLEGIDPPVVPGHAETLRREPESVSRALSHAAVPAEEPVSMI